MKRALTSLIAGVLSFGPALPAAEPPSFRNTIQPILTRYGCAMGACHGAAAGQGGFRLSLRGFDDEGDWISITRSANGRRLTLEDPARSLFLLKAVKAVPHKGDKRFEINSVEYKVISDWIAAGAPGPKADDPRIVSISLAQPHLVMQAGKSIQLQVTAKFSDGHSEDVTRCSKYNATNASVATVDDAGLIKTTGSGEGTVSVWYLSQLALATITIPNASNVDPAAFAALKPRNFIDELTLKKLRELNIPPSGRAEDHEFMRRAFLDTIGVLPTLDETRAFLVNKAADKRDRLIDSLLLRPEFVDYWSHRWSDLLLVNGD